MKRNYLIIVIISLVTLFAILTNLGEEQHRKVIKSKLNSYLQKSIKESLPETDSKFEKQATQALGTIFLEPFIEQLIDNIFIRDNYFLFSIAKISWDGETKTIGIGIFGNVFITNNLNELIDEEFFRKF